MSFKGIALGQPSLGIMMAIQFCFLSLFHVSIWQKGQQNCRESSAEVIGMINLKTKFVKAKQCKKD